jgi:hypothetical protein
MFIRKAVTLFLELWSEVAFVATASGETECVVDWRWFTE